MFAKFSAISFGIFFLGFTHSANGCTKSHSENQLKLEQILATDLAVFIGTVVDSGGPMRLWPGKGMAKFKVEIPIRGEVVKIFEVRNGGGGDCSWAFEVGQRWFFSGSSRSIKLVDEFGNVRPDDTFHAEIVKMFPEVLKLPSPSIVVQEYLKEK